MKILVDSSVLLDVLTQDPEWAASSEEKLAAHSERDLLAINPIIYAEVSAHFSTIEELDEALSTEDFQRLPLPYEAGFLAARCFLLYRRRGGQKHAPLPA
jgi:predicted nucleic acid-binding protein